MELTSDLLTRARDGDPSAMETVLKHYDAGPANSVSKLVFGVVRDLYDPEDVQQHVRLQIARALTTFEQRSESLERDFHAWVMAIARHHIVNLARRADKMFTGIESAVFEGAESDGSTASRIAAWGDAQATLQRCLVQLGPADRDIIQLSYLEALSDAQVAERLGLPESTVRGRRQRAVRRMRECMGQSSAYYFR